MCFTEQFHSHGLPESTVLRDLYMLGSPRIGGKDFSLAVKTDVKPPIGSTWRIANAKDVVPQIPPIELIPTEDVSIHVNAGYQLYPDQKPSKMSSEIDRVNTKPGPKPSIHNMAPHC
ncbi:MAG: hypothetical protein Q9188_007132, partial [Gyalolechia gomerana]